MKLFFNFSVMTSHTNYSWKTFIHTIRFWAVQSNAPLSGHPDIRQHEISERCKAWHSMTSVWQYKDSRHGTAQFTQCDFYKTHSNYVESYHGWTHLLGEGKKVDQKYSVRTTNQSLCISYLKQSISSIGENGRKW